MSGRPAGKRGTFSFRVTASLREKLTQAVQASGRPVSEEIEMRLERTFASPDDLTIQLAQAIRDQFVKP